MIKKLAVLVSSLKNTNDSIELIKALNELTEQTNIDASIFHLEWNSLPFIPCFGIFHSYDLLSFNGVGIATNLETAQKLLYASAIKKRYFYLQNLEWVTATPYNFSFFHSIYCNDNLELIVKTQEDFDLVKNCWKEPVKIMEQFNCKQLEELI